MNTEQLMCSTPAFECRLFRLIAWSIEPRLSRTGEAVVREAGATVGSISIACDRSTVRERVVSGRPSASDIVEVSYAPPYHSSRRGLPTWA